MCTCAHTAPSGSAKKTGVAACAHIPPIEASAKKIVPVFFKKISCASCSPDGVRSMMGPGVLNVALQPAKAGTCFWQRGLLFFLALVSRKFLVANYDVK